MAAAMERALLAKTNRVLQGLSRTLERLNRRE
jgi:hypothetical protein